MFLYDLNYVYSFKYIKEHRLRENIYKNTQNKDKFKEYFDYIINYVNRRILEEN